MRVRLRGRARVRVRARASRVRHAPGVLDRDGEVLHELGLRLGEGES